MDHWRDGDGVVHRVLGGDQTWCCRWSVVDLKMRVYPTNNETYYATCLFCAESYLNINSKRFPT